MRGMEIAFFQRICAMGWAMDDDVRTKLSRRAMTVQLVWIAGGLGLVMLINKFALDSQQLALGPGAWLVPLALFLSASCGGVQMFGLLRFPQGDRWWQQWWVIGLAGVPICAAVMALYSLREGHSFQSQLVQFTFVYGPVPALVLSAVMTPLARMIAVGKR
jgi:hypothetical protein